MDFEKWFSNMRSLHKDFQNIEREIGGSEAELLQLSHELNSHIITAETATKISTLKSHIKSWSIQLEEAKSSYKKRMDECKQGLLSLEKPGIQVNAQPKPTLNAGYNENLSVKLTVDNEVELKGLDFKWL